MYVLYKIMLVTAIWTGWVTTAAVAATVAETSQEFPFRPVRLLVPGSAGAQSDLMARMLGARLSETWRQPVVVDSRPGAGGALAGNIVAKSAPDGHTLLSTATFSIGAALQPDLPYDPLRDFAGVCQIGMGSAALIVAPALGVKSLKDLIALAKAQPGKLIYSSSATGTALHLSGARINRDAGIKVITVAFKGGPEATIEVLAGRAHYSYVSLAPVLPLIKEGKLLALGVSTPQRLPGLPDVPALAETLPAFKTSGVSYALLAPTGTPRPILNKISKDVARTLDLPEINAWFHDAGIVAAPSTPEEYDIILREQIRNIAAIAKELGLKPNSRTSK